MKHLLYLKDYAKLIFVLSIGIFAGAPVVAGPSIVLDVFQPLAPSQSALAWQRQHFKVKA